MNAFNMLEWHSELQDFCYDLARRNNGELMGDDAWLRNAITASDFNMYVAGESICCWGSCRSSQTMDTEFFDFNIPFDQIPDYLLNRD